MKALKHTLLIAISAASLTVPAYVSADNDGDYLFYDSLESGDMSTTNEDGFSWGRNNRTSIVTMDPEPTVIWSNGPSRTVVTDGRDWTPRIGDNALRFRYPAGESQSEQRFNLGGSYQELWFRYWIRVPVNFQHGRSNPSNHKFFAIWGESYSARPLAILEFWRGENTSRLAHHVNGSGHRDHFEFIRWPEDRGRWMQVILHFRLATDQDSNDGALRLWRKWEDESTFTQYFNRNDLDYHATDGGSNGLQNGYLMGWANAPYSEDTEWLIDGFTISTEKFPELDLAIAPPSPPTGISVSQE